MNITMIGLGKLGLPVAEVMAQHHTVRGYDISTNIRSDVINIKWSMIEACAEADIIFVAVPTPHDAQYGGETPSSHLAFKDFDYTALRSALTQIKQWAPPTALIVNISTVLPGTLRPIITRLDIQDRFCYNPYLIAMGTVAQDFIHPDIMMLGFYCWPLFNIHHRPNHFVHSMASTNPKKSPKNLETEKNKIGRNRRPY